MPAPTAPQASASGHLERALRSAAHAVFATFYAATVCAAAWVLGGAHIPESQASRPHIKAVIEAPEEWMAGMPKYAGDPGIRIGRKLQAAGAPMQVSYLATRDPVQRVAEYYESYWRTQGYQWVDLQTLYPDWAYVAVIDEAKKVVKNAVIQRIGDETDVFTSVVDISGSTEVQRAKSGETEFPTISGVIPATRVRSLDMGSPADSYTALATLPPAAAREALAKGLAQAGWQPEGDLMGGGEGGPEALAHSYRKGGRTALVSVSPVGGAGAAIFMHVTGASGESP